MSSFSIEEFEDMIDQFLKESRVQLLIELPKGTLDPEFTDNISFGPVGRLYILIRAIAAAVSDLNGMLLDREKTPELLDSIFDVVKHDILEAMEEEEEEDDQEIYRTGGARGRIGPRLH